MENYDAILVVAGALFLVMLAIAHDLELGGMIEQPTAFAISANPDYFTTVNCRRSTASY